MCKRMDMTCEFVAQNWDGIIPALLNGRYDVIMAGMSITDERRQQIDFTQGYVTTPAWFVAPKDSELQQAETIDQVREARSEEHTSELQSLMRISYAVFCLKKKNKQKTNNKTL